MRSRWKGKFFDSRIYRPNIFICSSLAVLRGRAARKRNYAFLWLKSSTVPSFLARKRIAVYNGYQLSSFIAHKYMTIRRVGEFVRTKLIGAAIHLRKKRKKAPKKKRGK